MNTAARLQSAAEPGEVLVSESTRRLTEHAFAFAPRGSLALKGKREPVDAYRVLAALAAPRSVRGLESLGLVAPLIGRDAALAHLYEEMGRLAFRSGDSQRAIEWAEQGNRACGRARRARGDRG